MKMKSAQNDMTVGNPMKIILSFTFPIFLGNVFQQFYNLADTWIVGKYVGDNALAAVGSSYDRFFVYGFKRSDKAFIKLKITASRRTQFVKTVCECQKTNYARA